VVCLCVARAAGLESTTLRAPLTSLSLCGNNLSQLSAIESAKLDLGLAYSINSLFWVYLCAQGVSPRDHPVKTELVSVCLLCSQHYLSSLPASTRCCGHTCLVTLPRSPMIVVGSPHVVAAMAVHASLPRLYFDFLVPLVFKAVQTAFCFSSVHVFSCATAHRRNPQSTDPPFPFPLPSPLSYSTMAQCHSCCHSLCLSSTRQWHNADHSLARVVHSSGSYSRLHEESARRRHFSWRVRLGGGSSCIVHSVASG
jgi:hypothetical protein